MNPLQDRLQAFLNYEDISMRAFERQCNIKTGTVSKMTERSYGTTFHKIAQAYPHLNIEWLKTGEGEMLNSIPKAAVIDLSRGRIGDNIGALNNYGELRKAGRDYYEEPCQEDRAVIEALTREIEHLTAIITEKDKRIDSLEQSLARKDAQLDKMIALLEKIPDERR